MYIVTKISLKVSVTCLSVVSIRNTSNEIQEPKLMLSHARPH